MSGFDEPARAAAAARQARPQVPLALATLVQVEGSSYRQPGARLLVDAEGRVLAGAVSGGCLEADVAARAAQVCASGNSMRLRYDLRSDLETIWGFGAACDGIAHLLLEPLPDWRWMVQAEAVRARRHGGAVVTVLRGSEDDAPEGHGGTWVLLDGAPGDGHWQLLQSPSDTIDEVRVRALTDVALRTGYSVYEPLDDDCTVFIEPLIAPIALHLVGAGRGTEIFARMACSLGWSVTVLDHRPALLDSLQVDDVVQRLHVRQLDAIDETLRALPADSRTAVALLTHIFEADLSWLAATLPLPLGYVGVLGSRTRGTQLIERVELMLAERGTPLTSRQKRKLYAPIGLDLGGESPASIALAAIAEIEAVMHARPSGFLRERVSPIHGRTPTPLSRPSTPHTER
ncbi:MAG: XdhC family protein [Gemmatimonadaceae bacterium]|nr:XdhC family protein [Gemmatimonadaceae bacterium]